MNKKQSEIERALAAQNEIPFDGEEIERMAGQIAMLNTTGRLPKELDMEAMCSDPAFIELAEELPAEAAVRVYAAEKRAAEAELNAKRQAGEQINRRYGLPRLTRSNIAANPKPDFEGMSSEAFRRYEKQLRQTSARGVRVPF